MRHDGVHHAHLPSLRSGVFATEEEDLPCELLTHLAGEVGAAEPAVEARHVGVGLLEPGVLLAGEGEVGHHVQAVATAGRPAGHHADHDLRHEPDEPLHLEDVQPPGTARLDALGGVPVGVLVTVLAADSLIAAAAERPAAIAR